MGLLVWLKRRRPVTRKRDVSEYNKEICRRGHIRSLREEGYTCATRTRSTRLTFGRSNLGALCVRLFLPQRTPRLRRGPQRSTVWLASNNRGLRVILRGRCRPVSTVRSTQRKQRVP